MGVWSLANNVYTNTVYSAIPNPVLPLTTCIV